MSVNEVDSFLSRFTGVQRAALEETRTRILEIVPQATQKIHYGIPTFFVDGKAFAGISGGKKFNSYYPYSGGVLDLIPGLRDKYSNTKSALHFDPNKPLPKTVIRQLIKATRSLL